LPLEATVYGNTFRVQHETRSHWLRHFFFQGNALCHPTAMIRRACYASVGMYNPALAQLPDLEMWVRLTSKFEIHVMQKPLVGFRILDRSQNASAGRPDSIVRYQWEVMQVLEHYLGVDAQLLGQAFPEIPIRTLALRKSGWLARLARQAVARRPHRFDPSGNEALSKTGRPGSNPLSPAEVSSLPIAYHLGKLAIEVGTPPYVLFGLGAIRKALLAAGDETRFRELIGLTGAYDVFDVLSKAPVEQQEQWRRSSLV
jgi:hypothetical protein